jgi:hypothetical protein
MVMVQIPNRRIRAMTMTTTNKSFNQSCGHQLEKSLGIRMIGSTIHGKTSIGHAVEKAKRVLLYIYTYIYIFIVMYHVMEISTGNGGSTVFFNSQNKKQNIMDVLFYAYSCFCCHSKVQHYRHTVSCDDFTFVVPVDATVPYLLLLLLLILHVIIPPRYLFLDRPQRSQQIIHGNFRPRFFFIGIFGLSILPKHNDTTLDQSLSCHISL